MWRLLDTRRLLQEAAAIGVVPTDRVAAVAPFGLPRLVARSADMLGFWLNPMEQCCAPALNGQLLRGGARFVDSEVLEDSPSVKTSAAEILVESSQLSGTLPAGPRDRMVPTYATAEDEPLHGDPLYEGNILQLTLGEAIHEMHLSVYVNGFSLTPCDSSNAGRSRTVSRAWSPFSLVEKCQVKTMQNSASWAVFKLTVFRKDAPDRCYYFASQGSNANKERDQWVGNIASTIWNVTTSLFPPHAITVQPIPDVATTRTRIMAGYLLQSGAGDSVSLFYCELHAYSGREARLAVYKDEWCQHEVSSVHMSDSSTVSTRKGAYCTVFGVDSHRFCARTPGEKDLWLRAVSNIKVKLMFDAPDPTDEELQIFRDSVGARVDELEDSKEVASDPLLAPVARVPLMSPRGDRFDPDPIEETDDSPVNEIQVENAVVEDGTSCTRHAAESLVKGHLDPEECRQLLRNVSLKLAKTPETVVTSPLPQTPPRLHFKPLSGEGIKSFNRAVPELLHDANVDGSTFRDESNDICALQQEICYRPSGCLPSATALEWAAPLPKDSPSMSPMSGTITWSPSEPRGSPTEAISLRSNSRANSHAL